MNVQGGFSPMSDNNHIQHLHCHILYRAIWFQLFDVGLLKKSDSIETVLSLMEHVKSCVSEMLVYRTFWNLKGGLGKKKPQTVLKCLLYPWLHQLPLPTASQCFTALCPTYGETFSFCSAGSQLLRKNRIWHFQPQQNLDLWHTPQGRILS